MDAYRLDYQEGYDLRSDPDSLSFRASSPEAAFVRAAEAVGLDPKIAIPEGVPHWEAFRRKGAKALVCDGVAISAPYDTLYYVDDGSFGYAYYVKIGRKFIAASIRKEVSDAIAGFLNGLPREVAPEEVLTAIRICLPDGSVNPPSEWTRGQIWSESDPRW